MQVHEAIWQSLLPSSLIPLIAESVALLQHLQTSFGAPVATVHVAHVLCVHDAAEVLFVLDPLAHVGHVRGVLSRLVPFPVFLVLVVPPPFFLCKGKQQSVLLRNEMVVPSQHGIEGRRERSRMAFPEAGLGSWITYMSQRMEETKGLLLREDADGIQ